MEPLGGTSALYNRLSPSGSFAERVIRKTCPSLMVVSRGCCSTGGLFTLFTVIKMLAVSLREGEPLSLAMKRTAWRPDWLVFGIQANIFPDNVEPCGPAME